MEKRNERDPQYLAFIARRPCLVCGGEAQAHHAYRNGGGAAHRASDYYALPLCAAHSNEIRQVGCASFEQSHNLDLLRVVIDHLVEYLGETR